MKRRIIKRLGSLAVAGIMFVCYPLAASAVQYDIGQGTISVLASIENGQTKYKVNGNDVDDTEIEITGNNGRHDYYVEITSGDGASALIRFNDLYIDNSTVSRVGAVITGGNGNVTIELDGSSNLKAGSYKAGIQKGNTGVLTIKDDNANGSLYAAGRDNGAGIGGGYEHSVDNIVIEGGTITAIGGSGGAGIGGGFNGSGTVTISGGNVTATGGNLGAGIGGGNDGSGTVTISGGNVTATGGIFGAGIGSGQAGSGTVIITGGTVIATSEDGGAGIGGGLCSNGSTITVSGPANVSARGGSADGTYGSGAAIGEGGNRKNSEPVSGANVTPDVSGLYTTGSVTTYAVGTSLTDIRQGTALGNTTVGTVPDPNANPDPDTNATTPEEPPVYTERSCIADVDVAALIGALLKSDPSATVLDIEFEDNICLTPDLMTALFADNRVAKNCYFWHEGKRYVLHIGAVNKQSPLYAEDFARLSEEPDGLAGFMMMAKIFENLGVTMEEVK